MYRDPPARPGVLICAGLDPSGGAGLIADVRTATQLGARPVGVVTALTVQNTTGVSSIEPVNAEVVREQLERLLSDVEVKAVKIGMLGSPEIAVAIGEALALTDAPLVWDPIMRPSLGGDARSGELFDGEPLARILAALAPHLTLITPNARELAKLVGRPITAVLVKGGHLGTAESPSSRAAAECIDALCRATGTVTLRAPRVPHGEEIHGTGCALSTAIATYISLDSELADACRQAKQFVAELIAHPTHPGRGAGAVV